MNIILKLLVAIFFVSFTIQGSIAVSGDFGDLDQQCFGNSESATGIGVAVQFGNVIDVTNRTEFVLVDDCNNGNEIAFTADVDLVLGPVQPGEIIIQKDSIFVDSDLRPDLDKPAQLVFRGQPFAVKPALLRDGSVCGPPDCVVEEYNNGVLTANVSGFSNYSLTGRQDFTVHSDEAPELQGKVYQVLDLGDSNRDEEFTCQVMIFAEDSDFELVLVQTNPERSVQAKLLGNPDTNQPESLGYFPTVQGVSNVYFRNDLMVGYTDFQYVAQCQSNSTQLIYEETIRPVNSPLGRNFAGRMVWLTTDNNGKNGFFLIFYIIVGVLVFWLGLLFLRRAGVIRG